MAGAGLIRRALLVAATALLAGGCGNLLPSPDRTQPSPAGGPIDADFGTSIDVSNGTALLVTIVVNDVPVGAVAAGTNGSIKPGQLPPKPWRVRAVTATGRQLLAFVVDPGDVTIVHRADGSTMTTSDGERADLSCGRLDVTVGSRMAGPVPGPGTPGDCVP